MFLSYSPYLSNLNSSDFYLLYILQNSFYEKLLKNTKEINTCVSEFFNNKKNVCRKKYSNYSKDDTSENKTGTYIID